MGCNKRRDLYDRIRRCHCGHQRPETNAFCFPIRDQRVMLITYNPSFQAAFRPMSSIRFFRHVYLALIGLAPARGGMTPSDFFHEKIYWTHYHKCYYPRGRNEPVPMNLPQRCASYLTEEIRDLSPEIIVLLGDPVAQRLLKLDRKMNPAEVLRGQILEGVGVLAASFPVTGAEPCFQEIRSEIKQYIKEIDDRPIPREICPKEDHRRGMAVHTWFELESLEYYLKLLQKSLGEDALPNTNPVLVEWFHGEVSRRLSYYAFIVACYSLLEDLLQPILVERPDIREQSSRKDGTLKPVCIVLDNLSRARYWHGLDDDLKDRIWTLGRLRNCIAHQGGRVQEDQRARMRVDGVEIEPSGVMRLSQPVLEFALEVVRDFIEFINPYEPRAHNQKT